MKKGKAERQDARGATDARDARGTVSADDADKGLDECVLTTEGTGERREGGKADR